jgi:membrane-bound serine protease (ClpP class)
MGILIMVAFLGIYIEMKTPGVWLPGLVAVICFVLIIGSKYLIGLANWIEVALFVTGLLLLLVEIFVIPGFGVAGVIGILFMLAGFFGILIKNPPGRLPWPESDFDWEWFVYEVLSIGLGFLGFVIVAGVLKKYLPKTQFFGRLVLAPAMAKKGDEFEVSMTAPPEKGESGINVGNIGEALSLLRPAGRARFGDAVVDVVAEGEYIGRGAKVKITEIHGNRVVVREA